MFFFKQPKPRHFNHNFIYVDRHKERIGYIHQKIEDEINKSNSTKHFEFNFHRKKKQSRFFLHYLIIIVAISLLLLYVIIVLTLL